MSDVQYELAASSWGGRDTIDIISIQNTIIASFHLEFVQRGGDNTWRYVLSVVERLVEPVPGHPSVLRDQDGVEVDLDNAPSSGEFVFARNGEPSFPNGQMLTANKGYCCLD
jgi:hypothetical protein